MWWVSWPVAAAHGLLNGEVQVPSEAGLLSPEATFGLYLKRMGTQWWRTLAENKFQDAQLDLFCLDEAGFCPSLPPTYT